MRGYLVACCAAGAAIMLVRAQTGARELTAEAWQRDVEYLAKEVPARHIDPFTVISRAEFERRAAKLRSAIPSLSAVEIRAGLQELVASLGDDHSNVRWMAGIDMDPLPIQLYWFPEGLVFTSAWEEYRDLLGARLLRIGGMPIEDACRRLSPLVSRENDVQLRSQLPNLLSMTALLRARGIAKSTRVQLDAETAGGKPISVEVQAVRNLSEKKWAALETNARPLYRRNPSLAYWATVAGDGSTVYFAYTHCAEDPGRPFSAFRADLRQLLAGDPVRRLVVDLRNN